MYETMVIGRNERWEVRLEARRDSDENEDSK
jgi:hypothetical protein